MLHRLTLRVSISAIVLTALSANSYAADTWSRTKTHAHPTGSAKFLRNYDDTEELDIVVVLKLRNPSGLQAKVASRNKLFEMEKTMDAGAIESEYFPLPNRQRAVENYLKATGFTNVKMSVNGLLLTATGTMQAIRKAFKTEVAHFVREGQERFANTTDVFIPSEFDDVILAVLGLQDLDIAHTVTVQVLNPTLFPAAYDANGLAAATGTVVGIVSDGNMTQTISDLHTFESMNGLPTLNPSVVAVGGSSSDTSNTDEWDLDSQTIQSMSGGSVGGMIFYAANSLSDAALTQVYNQALTDNTAKVINVSLGECESSAQASGAMASDDQIFLAAASQGQTFVVASGDHGSKECGSLGANGTFGTVAGQSYPASSPYVIAVGGTTLSTGSGGAYQSETAWTYGGGGPSLYEAQPGWQASIVPGSTRGVPDVAFDGDPSSGAQVVVNGSLVQYGGTSLAAPLFTGAWARLQTAHGNALGFPAPWIYQYGAVRPASAFHDVVSGSNGDYSAGVGWDYTTGFGSFDVGAVNAVVQAVALPPAAPTRITANNQTDCPRILVSWTASVGATSYQLYQESSASGWTGTGGLVWTGTSTQTDITEAAGVTFLWRAKACSANSCSGLSGVTEPTQKARLCQ